jgi:hypothetical protein
MFRKTMLYLATGLLLATLVSPGVSNANEIPIISLEDLKAKIDGGEKIVMLNPLADILYNEAFIPGSINVPIQQVATTDRLPSDKETLIVTYCLGAQ